VIELCILGLPWLDRLSGNTASKPLISMFTMGSHLPGLWLLSASGRELNNGFDFAVIILIGWFQYSLLVLLVGSVNRNSSGNTSD
jgi:hypothetical protein